MIHQVIDQFLVPVHWMDKVSEGQPCQDHVVGAHDILVLYQSMHLIYCHHHFLNQELQRYH